MVCKIQSREQPHITQAAVAVDVTSTTQSMHLEDKAEVEQQPTSAEEETQPQQQAQPTEAAAAAQEISQTLMEPNKVQREDLAL